jgi:hypothetical protein
MGYYLAVVFAFSVWPAMLGFASVWGSASAPGIVDARGNRHWVVLYQANAESQPPTWARPGAGEDAKTGETIPAVTPIYLNDTQA